jgi:cytochrome oxidase Cu insertion factor (SCO1/SenC/PrrC family)
VSLYAVGFSRLGPTQPGNSFPGVGVLGLLLFLSAARPAPAQRLLPPDPSVAIGNVVAFDGFVDELDRPFVRPSEGPARPWVVSPMYTRCPHTCSAITTALKRALAESGLQPDAYRVLSFSFDPAETAQALQDFRARMALPPEWQTLRAGDVAALQRILTAIDFRTISTGDGGFDHPNLVAVLAPDMRLAAYVFGVNFAAEDLGTAVRSARAGGSVLDRWRPVLFFFAAVGFMASAALFLGLLSRRRRVGTATPAH